MTRCTDPNSAYWDFYLHFVSRPTLNLAIMQLLSSFSLHSHTRPSDPSNPVFFASSSGCMRFLHRWSCVWVKEGHWHKDGGWHGVWDTCPCCLLIPSGPIWPQSQTFHFPLTVDCSWTCSTLWLGESNKAHPIMGSFEWTVTWCPLIKYSSSNRAQ